MADNFDNYSMKVQAKAVMPSVKEIDKQIRELEKSISKLKVSGKFDDTALKNLTNQLNTLKVNIATANFSPTALNELTSQVNKALSNINIGNINIGNTSSQLQQAGQQYGQQFQQGFNSAIQKGQFKQEFLFSADKQNKVAKDAQEYFSGISNGIVSVQERMQEFEGKSNLSGFTVNIKNAKGEVESLRYSLRNIIDETTGAVTGQMFKYTGGSINDKEAIKQIQAIENAFADYTQKLAQFKSTNTNILSGLTIPLQDFETKLAGLKNGTATIDDVRNSFKSLGTEASKVTANFTGQLSKTDAAIRKLSQGDEIMDGLKASFKGLTNAPKDINTELNKVSKLLRDVRNIESQEGRTANWSAKYREWSDEVDKLKARLSVLQKQQASMTTTQIFKTDDLKKADIAYMSKVYNSIEKQMSSINSMANAKGWTVTDVSGLEETDGKIKKLTITVRDAEGALKQFTMQREKLQGKGKAQDGLMQVGDVKVLETAIQAQEKLDQSTEKANAKLAEQQAKLANKIQLSTDITKLETDYKKFGMVSQEVETNLKELKSAHEAVINAKGTDRLASEIEKYDLALGKAKSSLKELTTTQVSMSQRTSQMHTMREWMAKNTAATKLCGDQVEKLIKECETCDAVRFNGIKNEFKGLQETARSAGKLGLGWLDSIKEQAKKFTQWVSVTSVVMEGAQQIRRMVNEVKVLDNAIMDLTMATGYNRNQVEDLMDTYFKLGDKLSATASDVAASADTWLRQGKSIEETNKLIEDSMILSKIGKLNSEDSTKYLTSVMKGYKVATEDVIGVVDKLSAVDMASATDVGGLAEGMSEVAASADLAGVSMDKLLGYLATIGEVTQSGMGEVGTTLNAVFARMGNIKLARLKDYQNNGEDLSNVETVLRGVGISLRDSEKSFRDFDEVLDETASNWTNYSEVQQRAIAQAFAGTHHMNEFIILMENYDTALKYTETSLGSTGQAMDKFEAYEESIAGHTEKFNNAFQNLSNTVTDSGLVNFFVDLGTTGVKAVDGLINALTPLGTIGVIGGGILGGKNAGICV